MRICLGRFRFAAVWMLFAVLWGAGASGGEAADAAYEAELARVRENLFAQYGREAAQPGGAKLGTRLAWSMIRIAAADDETTVDLASFRHDADSAEIRVRHSGEDAFIAMDESDLARRTRAVVGGYAFTAGYATLLQKPIGWMAAMSRAFRAADVAPEQYAAWEIMEAPGGLVALAGTDAAEQFRTPTAAFFQGAIRKIEAIPPPADFDELKKNFRAAAETLHKGVMSDAAIPPDLRRALEPVLAGTYSAIDPRDYFDGDFCRRLIEADYLEKHIAPLPPARAEELAKYRKALAAIESGIDKFAIDLGEDGRLVAVSRPNIDENNDADNDNNEDNDAAENSDENLDIVRDPETGETLSRYHWRWEQKDKTVFHSPLPSRYLYAMSVTEEFPGTHASRPAGVPERTEVWHALLGRLARHKDKDKNEANETNEASAANAAIADANASGDAELWQKALVLDARGGRDPNAAPLGWSFPLFVPVRNEQGDPVLVATERGTVTSPDFAAITDSASRRAAQTAWLDNAAKTLATPGELNLIYRLFFRYCSDSPLPELPNLIGSRLGLSDTHQTVYETLDRRWAGRLAGDCDDMAEFFQNIAARQGKLAHVMQLPSHAAAGWLEKKEEEKENPETERDACEFIVLQTGPALRFTAADRLAAVEKAYRNFDKDVGESQFSSSAVPILLRFANEQTRTPFVLSARIYWDGKYAEEMIDVQEYWHLNTFSAGIETMERMVATDRDPGNLKELASLYEQTGDYAKALPLREEELSAAGDDVLAALSALTDAARLHVRAKNKPAALAALDQMRGRLPALRLSDPALYARTLAYRSAWAGLLARLDAPERAWELMRYDVEETEKDGWRVSEPLMRILATLYDRMALQRDREAGDRETENRGTNAANNVPSVAPETERIRIEIRNALSRTFGAGYFKKDDSFNEIHSRYYWLGRYGVAVEGRKTGLAKLALDGPFPTEERRHAARTKELDDEDWEWFRIVPRLFLGLGLEMLDSEEHPELYDPPEAERMLSRVSRAADKGDAAGSGGLLGRDAVMQAELALSFLRNDLPAFRRLAEQVRGKDYSSLYDDSAVMFGAYSGFVPVAEFEDWIAAFRASFPGRQHYFKAAYRMLQKGRPAHAARFAEATAKFFPDDPLLTAEARALLATVRNIE